MKNIWARKRFLFCAAVCGTVAGMASWLVLPSSDAPAAAPVPSAGQQVTSGVIRQVVERPGVGRASVEDRLGDDELRVVLDGSSKVAPTSGEVTHAAISESGIVAWVENLERITVWNPRTDELTRLKHPRGTTAVFSPAFVTDDTITAVGQQPVEGVPGEDDGLNNLFEVDVNSGRWRAVTSFEATLTDWTALRTPVSTPAGDVLFVRVGGDSTATEAPTFELWEASDAGVDRVSSLPGEMYLAGFSDGVLRWNAPSDSCDDWGLYEESRAGLSLVDCGAVLADPLNATDPDLSHDDHAGHEAPENLDGEVAVIVGDFGTRAEALEVEARLDDAPGQRVLGHDSAPNAVGPGAWIVVRPVPSGVSPEDALERLREEVPGLGDLTFIGTPGN